jgi:hypothetical protein
MRGWLVAVCDAMAERRRLSRVPTNSNAYLKILRKLVEFWRGATDVMPADEVMNKTPVKEQAKDGASGDSARDRTHRDPTEN